MTTPVLEIFTLFQFQYGSIKSAPVVINAATNPQFQFQYGSIKSLISRVRFPRQERFNSNMVLLKVLSDISQYFRWWFQFQYGSIKSINSGAVAICDAVFQFQYGSIKRIVRYCL